MKMRGKREGSRRMEKFVDVFLRLQGKGEERGKEKDEGRKL